MKRVERLKTTSELRPGDIILWPWDGYHSRDTVSSVELPTDGGVLARLNFTNPANWIWSGLGAEHRVLETIY